MKKLIKFFEKEKIIIIIVVIMSLFPLYIPGFLYTHDGIIHLYRTVGAYNNIINFDFTNRIYYNMIDGFGYGWGIFYPPLSAVIPALFMAIGFSLFTAEKIFIIIASICAGLFSYKLFNELFKSKFCSLLCTLLYVLAPYKINQIIVRGAMGEILLFTFLPLVILGLIKILNKEYKYKYYFIFGICGIVYSHVISTVYIAIFAFIFLLLNIKLVINKKTLLALVKSGIIILLICLPVLVPLAEHQVMNIYNANSMTSSNVADNVVHFGQLIGGSIEGKEVENTGYFSNDKEMNYMIGLTSIIILILLPFAINKIKQNGEMKELVKYIILLIITILMMTLTFIWGKFSILDVIQYPWRILTFSTLFIAIISGYILKSLLTKENMYSFLVFVLGFSFIFVFLIGAHASFAKTLSSQFNFYDQELTQNDDFWTIAFALGYSHEYLPKQLDTEKLKNRSEEIIILNGDVSIDNFENGKGILESKVKTNSENAVLELPYVYYKGYTIQVDGKKIDYDISDNGFIKINISNIGEHQISLKYTGTILYNIVDLIAVIVLLINIIKIIRDKIKTKYVIETSK